MRGALYSRGSFLNSVFILVFTRQKYFDLILLNEKHNCMSTYIFRTIRQYHFNRIICRHIF